MLALGSTDGKDLASAGEDGPEEPVGRARKSKKRPATRREANLHSAMQVGNLKHGSCTLYEFWSL